MKKIALIRNATGENGGIEHQITYIAKSLSTKYQLFLITNDEHSPMATNFSHFGKVIVFPFQQHDVFQTGKKISQFCKEEKIDILQSHMLRESFAARIAKFYYPQVKHIFRVHTYIDCSFIPKWKKNIYHSIAYLSDRYVDIYASINQYNVHELLDRTHVNKNKIMIIPNGVRALNAPAGDKESYYHIAMVGNFIAERGYDIAFQAMKALVEKDHRFHLFLVGGEATSTSAEYSQNYTSVMKQMITDLKIENNVTFCGYTEDIGSMIQTCGVMILPAYDAGTPNCLLEAMSIQKIVVASNVGGIPEFVKDGETGYLHKNKDVQGLVDILASIPYKTEDELSSIKEKGYWMWKHNYSTEYLFHHFDEMWKNFD